MNRPFSAFGALLAMLALAMFAVSSTSRSTTVQDPRARVQEGVSPHWRAVSYSNKRTRKAVECEGQPLQGDAADDGLCLAGSFDDGCEILADGDLQSLDTSGAARTALARARVEMAENTQGGWQAPAVAVDCRSHYDAVYDLLIYGISDEAGQRQAIERVDEPRVGEAEWMELFHALATDERNGSPALGAAHNGRVVSWSRGPWTSAIMAVSLWRGGGDGGQAWTMTLNVASGFQRWMSQRLTGLMMEAGRGGPLVSRGAAVEWSDYAEMIERVAIRPLANPAAARISDAGASVRSSGWLRHSAASSLYQLGLMLQAAGNELERGVILRSSLLPPGGGQ